MSHYDCIVDLMAQLAQKNPHVYRLLTEKPDKKPSAFRVAWEQADAADPFWSSTHCMRFEETLRYVLSL